MQDYPRAVTGTFIVDNGKVLLIRFNDKKGSWSGKWTVPGGKVEFGERIVDAVKREAKEETGLDVEVLKLIDVDEAIVGSERHYIFLNYLCKVIDGQMKASSDASGIGWFTKDELDKIELNSPVTIRRTLSKIGFL